MRQIERSCPGCGRSVPPAALIQSRCPRCVASSTALTLRAATGSWSPGRDKTGQARFRKLLLERSGGRCEYVFPSGHGTLRCAATENLKAHHDRPGFGVESGRMLCDEHHENAKGHWYEPGRQYER